MRQFTQETKTTAKIGNFAQKSQNEKSWYQNQETVLL